MMRRLHWLMLCSLLAVTWPVAWAANWLSVGKLGDANQHAYDASKLSFETDEVTYWRRIIFTLPVERPNGSVVLGLYRERVNCRKHTLQLLDWLLYDSQNRMIERAALPDGEVLPIVPDTIGDAFSTKLCPLIPPQTTPSVGEGVASTPVPPVAQKKTATPTKPVTPAKPVISNAPVTNPNAASNKMIREQIASQVLPVLLGDDMIMIPGNGEKGVAQ